MSCPRLDEHLRSDLDRAEQAELAAHAASCPDCRRRLDVRRDALAILVTDVPPFTPLMQARQWTQIRGRVASPRRAPRLGFMLAGGLAAAVAAAVVFAPADPGSTIAASGHGEVRLEAGEVLELEGLRAVALGATLIELSLAARTVRVAGGELELAVERAEPAWVLLAPRGPIPLVATRVRLHEGRALEVLEGTLTLGGRVHQPGERLDLDEGAPAREQARAGSKDEAAGAHAAASTAERSDASPPSSSGTRSEKSPAASSGARSEASAAARSEASAAARSEASPAARSDASPAARSEASAAARSEASAAARSDASPAARSEASAAARSDASAAARSDASARSTSADRADAARVAEARALLGRDDRRATELAEEVIARRPGAATEAAALMVAADGWRRRGAKAEAERYYALAAAHPAGGGFLEESQLRRATLLHEMRRSAEALALLETARARYGAGGLGPERTALYATICHARGEHLRAAEALEQQNGGERVLDEPRVLVAEALLATDPARAAALAKPVADRPGALQERAARIASSK